MMCELDTTIMVEPSARMQQTPQKYMELGTFANPPKKHAKRSPSFVHSARLNWSGETGGNPFRSTKTFPNF